MNRTAMIYALFATTCCAQQTVVQPDPSERPSKPFSNAIPDGTAWVVTIKKPWELGAGKAKAKDPAQDAARKQAEAAAKMKQKYNIRQ